jgi:hypothetical protein
MKIYIASSWSNEHAVEMLTYFLREKGHTVKSFVEDGRKRNVTHMPFEKWMQTDDADGAFEHDSTGAMDCQCLIYISQSGKDAAAECGMAYTRGAFMIGLWAKKEDFGLMRKMFQDRWCFDYNQVLNLVEQFQLVLNNSESNE